MDNEANRVKAEDPETAAKKRFVKFQYAEMKDLAKHFLTLIAGTLVLAVSFLDKLAPLNGSTPAQKAILATCLGMLFVSFVVAGAGLAGMFLAAVAAREGIVFDRKWDYRRLSRPSYLAIDLGGILFVAALALLAILGAVRLLGT